MKKVENLNGQKLYNFLFKKGLIDFERARKGVFPGKQVVTPPLSEPIKIAGHGRMMGGRET
ncbi:MAG: hypothetical protein F3741_05360 [Nitrospinae bacterium]|nr:hypothetical protein [Nitrospinota bacterium]MZH40579.1 hypothetical protein [Nitrospinota bacterium]